jgi:hypothetical protein
VSANAVRLVKMRILRKLREEIANHPRAASERSNFT